MTAAQQVAADANPGASDVHVPLSPSADRGNDEVLLNADKIQVEGEHVRADEEEEDDIICQEIGSPREGDDDLTGGISLDEVRDELMRIKQRLPKLKFELETDEHVKMLTDFRTEACDLPLRQCLVKRGKGCLKYHSQQHFRRKLLQDDGETLAYFDMLCRFGDTCPLMDDCPFAHSKTELLVHPAKYKTRCCDSFKCFDDNCCFVHEGEVDRRTFAVQYSFVTEAHPDDFVPLTEIPGQEPLDKPKGGKLCGSFPNPMNCVYGPRCRFAHKRSELGSLLFRQSEESVQDVTDEFLILKYKTKWCPHLYQHNWTYCVYAHNYQDYRRNPQIGYGPVPCPFWDPRDTAKSNYNDRCKFGAQCPFSHGSKERAYHPLNFKVSTCQDIGPNDCRKDCTREPFCAFYHDEGDKRPIVPHVMNYSKPLPLENIVQFLQKDFFEAGIGYNHQAKRLSEQDRLKILKSPSLSPVKKACLLDGVNFVQPISNLRPFRDSVRNMEKAALQKELKNAERRAVGGKLGKQGRLLAIADGSPTKGGKEYMKGASPGKGGKGKEGTGKSKSEGYFGKDYMGKGKADKNGIKGDILGYNGSAADMMTPTNKGTTYSKLYGSAGKEAGKKGLPPPYPRDSSVSMSAKKGPLSGKKGALDAKKGDGKKGVSTSLHEYNKLNLSSSTIASTAGAHQQAAEGMAFQQWGATYSDPVEAKTAHQQVQAGVAASNEYAAYYNNPQSPNYNSHSPTHGGDYSNANNYPSYPIDTSPFQQRQGMMAWGNPMVHAEGEMTQPPHEAQYATPHHQQHLVGGAANAAPPAAPPQNNLFEQGIAGTGSVMSSSADGSASMLQMMSNLQREMMFGTTTGATTTDATPSSSSSAAGDSASVIPLQLHNPMMQWNAFSPHASPVPAAYWPKDQSAATVGTMSGTMEQMMYSQQMTPQGMPSLILPSSTGN
ncbi:unnamed protein product [Amoebophrya sp. A25]|nr:unnamed protein product [Amoebophrya sp. A25]|eukprot:GSA25T00024609001.1